MLVHPSAIDLSTAHLRHLACQLAKHRRETGTRWRRLSVGRQALLVLAHLRCGDTYAQLAAGYRYVREEIEGPADLAPTLDETTAPARKKAYPILDGTVLPIDRIAADRPYCSGKKKLHGRYVQVLTGPFGRLLWASPALPGATHDLTAAREHGIINALAAAGLPTYADKAYQGAGRPVRVPFRGRHLKRWQRRPNTVQREMH